MLEYLEFEATHVAFAKTKQPPARPPPQHAQPIPSVHATCLSSFGAVHISKRAVTKVIIAPHAYLKAKNKLKIRENHDFWPAPTFNGISNVGKVESESCTMGAEKGAAAKSDLAARMASSLVVKIRRKIKENAIKKKYPSQPPRRQR